MPFNKTLYMTKIINFPTYASRVLSYNFLAHRYTVRKGSVRLLL